MLAQDYNITLEEALEKTKHRPDFQKKIKHSVELLRKAEKLALKYDSEDGFYLAFSCGKDSQAMFHIAKMAGVKFNAHMNFTSVDPPQVIIFKRRQYPSVVEHAPRASIFDLAVEKGILPSMRIRWCCAELKESAGAGKVTLIGIRRDESSRRAKRHEVEVSNKKFSGNLDQFAEWQQEEISKKEEKLMRKMKREGKKVNEDQFSLDKDNEVRCINGKDSILVSPIFDWSESDVWYFLNNILGVPHCELYDQGYTRIGCILCPMSQFKHKLRELRDFPHVKRGWIRAIKEIRARGGIQQNKYTQDSSGGTFQQSDCREKSAGCSATGSAATPPPTNQRKVRDLRKLVLQESMERNVSATGSGSGTIGGFSTHTHTHTQGGRLDSRPGQPLGSGTDKPTKGSGRVFCQSLC